MRQPEQATKEAAGLPFEQLRFQMLIQMVMRTILIRDEIASLFAGNRKPERIEAAGQRTAILSGSRWLDGWLMLPPAEAKVSVLILHGIGERLTYWQEAQSLLARHGVASLIFDYSGYGRSAGATTPENLREDMTAAYVELRRLTPAARAPFILGFSLGTGVAVDATPHLKPPPCGVILFEAFTSLREAALAVTGILPLPRFFTRWLVKLLPDTYRIVESVARIRPPLLIVHSDADQLFPLRMASEIFLATGKGDAALFIAHGLAHNDAYLHPSLHY